MPVWRWCITIDAPYEQQLLKVSSSIEWRVISELERKLPDKDLTKRNFPSAPVTI